jgi:hypothetical protein
MTTKKLSELPLAVTPNGTEILLGNQDGTTVKIPLGSLGNSTVTGILSIVGSFNRGAPITKTADFTLATTENWVINNKASASCIATLPLASDYVGREIYFLNYKAFTLVSASSNIIPLVGGAASTAILSATIGKFCTLVSDGTNWVIMNAN